MLSDHKSSQKTDLRVRKTELALLASMCSILNECQFAKMTVDKLCREGQLSRATFYSHFMDKYDLLEFWLSSFWTYKAAATDTYEDVKEPINQFVSDNKKVIKNLLVDADHQTLEIVLNFLCTALGVNNAKYINGKLIQKNIVAANLYIGGIVYYLLWQVGNDFPPEVPIINEHSFGAIEKLWYWAQE